VYLGASILGAFFLAGLARGPLEGRWVTSAVAEHQPRRQFFLELGLAVSGAVFVVIFNKIVFYFPVVKSGSALFTGFLTLSFFIGIDMALARERALILKSKTAKGAPPERLYSVTKRFSLVAITSVLTTAMVLGMVLSKDLGWLRDLGQEPEVLRTAQRAVVIEVLFIMAVLLALLVNLIISYSKNLKLLFANETRVLQRVSRGDLSTLVPVATKDEFGFIAGHTNHMIEGLRHRMQLVSSLKLAEEVQQKLLPQEAPRLPGLDVAGTSVYCDETGGDYYDYFILPGERLVTVVADASDHGVGAALDMTTVRAFLKYGIRHQAVLAELLAQVNRFLSRDSADTGRFTTLFLLDVDLARERLAWIRAGQDPALVYDPGTDRFEELDGRGIALGLDEDARFETSRRKGWPPGAVVLVATDGLHETRDDTDQLFGRERVREILRAHAAEPASRILEALIAAGETFRGAAPQEDDLTLVVIKFEERPGEPTRDA